MPVLHLSVIAWLSLSSFTQDPLTVAPAAYRSQFENDWVSVVRVRYKPRESIPSHDHPTRATVYVYLSDSGPVRFKHTGDEKFSVERPAVKAGGFRLGRAVKETHEVESLSDRPTDFLRVELKTEPVDTKLFRGRYPPDKHTTLKSSQKVRFENGQVRISRITCAAQGMCGEPDGSRVPSILVALTPAQFEMGDKDGVRNERRVGLGETVWVEPGTQLRLKNLGRTPAEFLRIELKSEPIKGR